MTGYIVVGVLILLAIYFVGLYNGLIRARNQTKNGWAQIDVQLKRRHDLIPNLVETAKGYMKHEAETLEKVVVARNQAVSARGPRQAGAAEGALTGALSGFFGLVEQYPDLKANQNFLALQEELASTENRAPGLQRRGDPLQQQARGFSRELDLRRLRAGRSLRDRGRRRAQRSAGAILTRGGPAER